jgi:hypothetical protein
MDLPIDCKEICILFWDQQVRRKKQKLPMFRNKQLVEITSQVELPFSAEVAYDAYSNLTRPITNSVGIQTQ